MVRARIVCCVGRPIKVFKGTKFDINSKWSLCLDLACYGEARLTAISRWLSADVTGR